MVRSVVALALIAASGITSPAAPTVLAPFNVFDSTPDGNQWTTDQSIINVPAGVGTTTVQVNSTRAGQNPDELLWELAALRVQQLDATEPSCSAAVTNAGPPKQVTHTIQDTGSGLAEILVTASQNADTVVPPFTVGTTDPVVSTSTKIDQTQPMKIEIRVTDLAGNVTFCGYADARVDVTKDRVPDGAQVFEFTGSGSIGFFQLDDDADPGLPDTTSFIVELGSYTVTETTTGYVTTVACTDPTANTTVSNVARMATISADAGETVACTFTNTDSGDATAPSCSPAVTNAVPKQVTHTVQDTGSGLAEILVLVSQNADTVVPPFTPGTTVPVEAISTKIDQSQPMNVQLRVTDLADNSFLCAYADARIDVTKDTVPDAAQDFPFTASGGIGAFSLDDDADPTLPNTRFFIVELGFVTVAEGGVAGYDTTVACIDPFFDTSVDNSTRSATISADAAETIECTFTNTATQADLQVTKTTTATTPGLNETFDYVLTVLNDGPAAATGVQVSDTLPPQLELVGSDCGATAVGPVVTWDIGPLAVAGSAECVLTVRVVAPGAIANTAVVTAAEPDPDSSNNSSSSTIAGGPAFIIPTLDWRGLLLLVMAFGALAPFVLRR